MNTLTEKGISLLYEGHAEIVRLFHVASMMNTDEFQKCLSEMETADFADVLPDITIKELVEYDEDERAALFHDRDMFGFFAQCRHNVMINFQFREDGSFSSYSNSCAFIEFYAYGETMEKLIDKVREIGDKYFEEEVNKARKEQGIVWEEN